MYNWFLLKDSIKRIVIRKEIWLEKYFLGIKLDVIKDWFRLIAGEGVIFGWNILYNIEGVQVNSPILSNLMNLKTRIQNYWHSFVLW